MKKHLFIIYPVLAVLVGLTFSNSVSSIFTSGHMANQEKFNGTTNRTVGVLLDITEALNEKIDLIGRTSVDIDEHGNVTTAIIPHLSKPREIDDNAIDNNELRALTDGSPPEAVATIDQFVGPGVHTLRWEGESEPTPCGANPVCR